MARVVDREAKRVQILEAASSRFAEAGYDATSMDDVAAAAGVSKGSLYDYFKNKEDLFYGVFEWFLASLMGDGARRMEDETSAYGRLFAFTETSVTALVSHIALYPVTLEVWAAAAKAGTRERFSAAMRELYIAYRAEVTAIIDAGQKAGEIRREVDAEAVAAMLVGAIDGLFLQYWLDRSFDPHRYVERFLGALFEGLIAAKG